MRSSVRISLSSSLRAWVDDQVEAHGFCSAAEFLRDILRRERDKSRRDQIDQAILKAVESPVSEMTEADWIDIEKDGRMLAKKRKRA
jgi:Arc/MetJ-type ribon-helix-helix transcriptional regulator